MKKENGVTLVALVITVIVILILAGITISLTIGQDGIITRAQQAGKNYLNAQEYEELQIAELTNEMQNILTNGTLEKNPYDGSSFRASVIKAIDDAGVNTPEDATDEIIVSNIGRILKEGTLGNATADNISEGRIAWVNGEKIIGTGKDNITNYEQGMADGKKIVKIATINSDSNDELATQIQSINVSSYEGFQNFSTSNFLLDSIGVFCGNTNSNMNRAWVSISHTKNYNSATGIFTITTKEAYGEKVRGFYGDVYLVY